MEKHKKNYPEIGWFKERFKVLAIRDNQLDFECLMSGKAAVPPHFHSDCDEEFTAIEGNLTVKIGDEVHVLEPSQKIVVPKGEVHSLRNPSKEKIRFKATMRPNNGVSSLFEIMMFLKEKYPDKNYSIVTAMYILNKLNLKEFSTPVGIDYYVESFAVRIAFLIAPLFGWPKLAKEYSRNR